MKQLLMHRVTACNYLDMDEFTFEAYIVPIVTSLRFGEQLYYLSSQLEDAVYALIEASGDTEVHLHLVD
jgi:hypothetical protein